MVPLSEQQARGNIDRLLEAAGWHVCDAAAVTLIRCKSFFSCVPSKSRGFFVQMKGRVVRVMKPDDLKAVTPCAKAKDHFVVGVCEQDLRERTKIANRMFEGICA